MMREAYIEAKLRQRVKDLGGMYRKVTYQGRKGAPDDWCFFPDGRLIIVECKAPGRPLEPRQVVEIDYLNKLGFTVYVIDSLEQIEVLIK